MAYGKKPQRRYHGDAVNREDGTDASDGDRSRLLELFTPRRVAILDLRPASAPFIPRWTCIARNPEACSPNSQTRPRVVEG